MRLIVRPLALAAEARLVPEDLEGQGLPGGRAAGRPGTAFNAKALAEGVAHELEHTDDRAVASEIARNHLVEDPRYYEKLCKLDKANRSPNAALPLKRAPKDPDREFPLDGRLEYQGLAIDVENRAGATRTGKAADGTAWSTTMTAHYGEFTDTEGTDGDPVDVFVGPDADAPMAYVVHTKVPGTEVYDEDKVVVGVRTAREAEALFRANYDRPGFFAGLTVWPVAELRAFLQDPEHRGQRLDRPRRVLRIMLGKAVLRPSVLWKLWKAGQLGLFGGQAASERAGRRRGGAGALRATKPAGGEQAGLFERPVAPAPRAAPRAPAGYTAIPGSRHGGYHLRQADGTYSYWYPGEGTRPGHPVDKTAVEHAGVPLVRLVPPDGGEAKTRHDFVFASDAAVHPMLWRGEERALAGPGTTIRGAGRTWTITEHDPSNYRNPVKAQADTGETFDGTWWHFHEELLKEHEDAAGRVRDQRVAMVRTQAEAALTTLRQRLAQAVASPTEVGLIEMAQLLEATRERVSNGGWWGGAAIEFLAGKLGVSTEMPKSWPKFAVEVQGLEDRLMARLPGRLYAEFLGSPENVLKLGLDDRLMRDALRLQALHEGIRTYAGQRRVEAGGKGQVRVLTEDQLVEHLPEAMPEGGYTPAQIQQALQAVAKSWLGRAARPAELRQIVIDKGWKLSTEGDGAEKARAILTAIEELSRGSGGKIVALRRRRVVDDGLLDWNAASDWSRATDEALAAAGRKSGVEACPDILDDDKMPPGLTLPDLVEAAQDLDGRFHATGKLLVVQHSPANPVVPVTLSTGRQVTRGSGASQYTTLDTHPVLLPLELALAAKSATARATVPEFRREHRERLGKLRTALDSVKAKLGDPLEYARQALEDFARRESIDPTLVAQAVPKYMNDSLWSRAHALWALVHPEKAARDRYGSGADETERRALSAERLAFTARVRHEVSAVMLERLRADLGHDVNPEAARGAVHQAAQLGTTERPREHYDIEADPADLAKVWSFLSKDMIPHVSVAVEPGLKRAFCGWDNSIVLEEHGAPERRGSRVLWHEYGHAIEHDHPEVRELANTLRDERGKGQARRRLAQVHGEGAGYEDHEVTYEDKWAQPYTGKWYGHQHSTEVLSMGTEALIGDPLEFYREDPEHFLFTVGALSGMLGTTKRPVHPAAKGQR